MVKACFVIFILDFLYGAVSFIIMKQSLNNRFQFLRKFQLIDWLSSSSLAKTKFVICRNYDFQTRHFVFFFLTNPYFCNS